MKNYCNLFQNFLNIKIMVKSIKKIMKILLKRQKWLKMTKEMKNTVIKNSCRLVKPHYFLIATLSFYLWILFLSYLSYFYFIFGYMSLLSKIMFLLFYCSFFSLLLNPNNPIEVWVFLECTKKREFWVVANKLITTELFVCSLFVY